MPLIRQIREQETDDLLALQDDTGAIIMSNRKPFNGHAGYVASRINPLTGIHNVIYIASEAGIDAPHKYVTVCGAHATMVSSTSIPLARMDMKSPSEWCEQCQSLRRDIVPN